MKVLYIFLICLVGTVCPVQAEFSFSDYYSSLSFRESPYAAHLGVHRLTAKQAEKRNHYRFDYDEKGRISRISFALGDTLRPSNHTANYFWYNISREEYQYKNDKQIVTYKDKNNKPTEVKGSVFYSQYTLDNQGRRIALTYLNKKKQPIENNWHINKYTWEHQNDGSIIEIRRNLAGEIVSLRPGFEFQYIRLSYDTNGYTALMQHVDKNGKVIAIENNFAQDKFTMSEFGELLRYDVLNANGQLQGTNRQGIASGLLTFTNFGYERIASYLDAEGMPVKNNYGWGRSFRQYDQFGNLISSAFKDLNDIPKNNPNTGYATSRFKWHKDGLRRQWFKYFGQDNNPISHKTRGYHGILYDYDENNRLIQISLVNEQGKLTQHLTNNWAVKRYFYDESGNRLETKAFTLEQIKSQQLQSMLDGLQKSSNVPGIAVAISQNGKISWQGQAGYSNYENKKIVTEKTQFRLASVSKAVTSILAAIAIENGLISLATKANDLLDVDSSATLAQLMAHTGSVAHYEISSKNNLDRTYRSSLDALVTVENRLLNRTPGEIYHYSTFGYSLLAAMLEVANNKTFPELITQLAIQANTPSLIAPLGNDIQDDYTQFYDISDREVKPARKRNFSYSQAGAGLMSNAGDLANLFSRFASNNLVSKKQRDSMLVIQKLNSGELISDRNYQVALGWRKQKALNDEVFYHHAGVTDGARSIALINPRNGTSVVILSNASWTADMFQTAFAFYKQFSINTDASTNDLELENASANYSVQLQEKECTIHICNWYAKQNISINKWLEYSGRGAKYWVQKNLLGAVLMTPYGLSWIFESNMDEFNAQIGRNLIEIEYNNI